MSAADDIPAEVETPEQHLAAPIKPAGRLVPRQGTRLPDCPTNLNLNSLGGRVMLFNALNPGDIDLGVQGAADITARYYVCHPDQGVNPETGEVSEFTRTILIAKDGTTFRTTSAHAPHRIAAALDLFGPEDWEHGIKFSIKERRSRRTGRTYHDIRIVGVEDSE